MYTSVASCVRSDSSGARTSETITDGQCVSPRDDELAEWRGALVRITYPKHTFAHYRNRGIMSVYPSSGGAD